MAFTFNLATASPNPEEKQPDGAVADTQCSATPVAFPALSTALSNEDILSLIFQELYALFGGEDVKKRNQSILWAAQTSKTFFRPAVGALWRIIQSLLPLLKTLPQFKTSETVHVGYIQYSFSMSWRN